MMPEPAHWSAQVTLAAALLAFGMTGSARAACPATTVALDTSLANSHARAYLGSSYGQVFWAEDTLLASVTVWRSPQSIVNRMPMRLWIANVDSLLRPAPGEVLYIGQALEDTNNDGVHPTRFDYILDPPFALPHKGHYFFAIKEELCAGGIDLLSDSLDVYPFGDAWMIRVGLDCDFYGSVTKYPWAKDLIFELQFCTTDTAVGKRTWGSVKRSYKN